MEKCKHNQIKTKCEECYSEKFPWCNVCKKSKVTFGASKNTEGGRDSICKCK